MKKFPTKDQMRSVRVFNSHGLAGLTPQKVYICFSPGSTGRGCRPSTFRVIHIGFQTDPKSHWQDGGHKTFAMWGRRDKDAAFGQAVGWANAKFGPREWVRDPFGSYQDPAALDLIWKMIKEAV